MLLLKQKLITNHYAGTVPSGKTHYFAYEDAVLAFSIPANNNVSTWLVGEKNCVWELSRMWAPDGHRPNLLTEAIAHAVSEFRRIEPHVQALISYADPNDAGTCDVDKTGHLGIVYQAASWVYCGQCEDGRYFLDTHTKKVVPRRQFHKGRNFIRDGEIIQLENGRYQKFNLPGKHRYARGLTRKARARIELRRTPYPKPVHI